MYAPIGRLVFEDETTLHIHRKGTHGSVKTIRCCTVSAYVTKSGVCYASNLRCTIIFNVSLQFVWHSM